MTPAELQAEAERVATTLWGSLWGDEKLMPVLAIANALVAFGRQAELRGRLSGLTDAVKLLDVLDEDVVMEALSEGADRVRAELASLESPKEPHTA